MWNGWHHCEAERAADIGEGAARHAQHTQHAQHAHNSTPALQITCAAALTTLRMIAGTTVKLSAPLIIDSSEEM